MAENASNAAYMPAEKVYPLAKALETFELSPGLQTYLLTNLEMWMTFGKMNSHLYRKELMERMEKADLSGEERFMIHFLFAVVKNQMRVLKALDNMSSEGKSQVWFTKVRAFVDGQLCHYVTQVSSTKKFPAVNIPATNPGLDIMCWVIFTEPKDQTALSLVTRTTFSQLALDTDVQADAKDGYQLYWDNIVKGSRNPEATALKLPAPQMREEYYENQAADQYQLVNLDFTLQPIAGEKYSWEQIVLWVESVNKGLGRQNFVPTLRNDLGLSKPVETSTSAEQQEESSASQDEPSDAPTAGTSEDNQPEVTNE
jgi:hypothetical protein